MCILPRVEPRIVIFLWLTSKSSFNLSSLTDAIASALGEDCEGLPVVVATTAIGLGVKAFTKVGSNPLPMKLRLAHMF
ncbi:hypothetical protein SDJN03_30183, partial [Cucurbita argyrosperma subsp. sororia]